MNKQPSSSPSGQQKALLGAPEIQIELSRLWKWKKGKVQLLTAKGRENLEAKEAEFTVYRRGEALFSVPVTVLCQAREEAVWLGRKMDVYFRSEGSVLGVSLSRSGACGVEWATNCLKASSVKKPIDSVLTQFQSRIDERWFFHQEDYFTHIDLLQEFYAKDKMGSGPIGRIGVQLKQANVNGKDLTLAIKGQRGAEAILVLDIKTYRIAKMSLNGKQMEISPEP